VLEEDVRKAKQARQEELPFSPMRMILGLFKGLAEDLEHINLSMERE
jgi:hypothetical protein